MNLRFIRIFISASILAFSYSAFSQTVQPGVVKEYNETSQKTPLEGVELNVRNANNAVSAKDGSFSLQFLTLKPGEKVTVRRIEKLGYEIFNKEALEQWNLNPTTPFVIVLCRSDKFKAIRDNYKRVASENYNKQYKKEQARLAKLKADGKLKDKEYEERLSDIQEEYERQLDNIENYVDRFSRIDLSELSKAEQKIILLVQEGKFEDAIRMYEDQGLLEQYTKQVSEIKTTENAISRLDEVKSAMVASRDSLLAAIDRQIETLQLAGGRENMGKIAGILRGMTDADPDNIDFKVRYGEFLVHAFSDFKTAEQCYTDALRLSVDRHGAESEPAVDCYMALGELAAMLENFDEAVEYYEKAEDILDREFGGAHKDLATCHTNLGAIYYDCGVNDNALEYYEKARDFYETNPDLYQTNLCDIYNNLGVFFSSSGDYDTAISYHAKALDILKTSGTADYLQGAVSYVNLGAIYLDKEDFAAAKECFDSALYIRLRILGDDHPLVATVYNHLGSYYSDLQDSNTALGFYTKALEIREKYYGSNHTLVATSYNNVAAIHYDRYETDMALSNFLKALAIYETKFKSNPKMASICDNIAACYRRMGDLENATVFTDRAISIWAEYYPDGHPNLGYSYISKGDICQTARKFEDAIHEYQEASEIFRKYLGPEHTNVALCLEKIAHCHRGLNDPDSALSLYEEALRIKMSAYGSANPSVANTLAGIGLIKFETGRFAEALDVLGKAYDIFYPVYGSLNASLLNCANYMYNAYHALMAEDRGLSDDYANFMTDKIFIANVTDPNYPAAQQGMSGIHYILSYSDWDCTQEYSDFFANMSRFKELPKDIVEMKDGVITSRHFDGIVGCNFSIMPVSIEEKKQILDQYLNWKKNQ